MKKLFVVCALALSASLAAMDANNQKLDGDARRAYDVITQSPTKVTAQKMRTYHEEYPELIGWKTNKRKRPLLHLLVEANNVEAVRVLLEKGADLGKEFRGQTVHDIVILGDAQDMKELLKKAQNGELEQKEDDSLTSDDSSEEEQPLKLDEDENPLDEKKKAGWFGVVAKASAVPAALAALYLGYNAYQNRRTSKE